MDYDQTLEGLLRTIGMKVASALSIVRLLTAIAPFCDPALSIVASDLEDVLCAVKQARALTDELNRVFAGSPPSRGTPER